MKTIKLIFLLLILFVSKTAFSQYGTLDTTFDSDGKVITFFGNYYATFQSLAFQQDGKIIAAGTVDNHGGFYQFGIARYNPDGSLDSTFGIDGKVIGDFLGYQIGLKKMVLQSDGKILVSGIIYTGYTNTASILARYNSNGSLDSTFGNNGFIVRDFFQIFAMVLQTDGKIIETGSFSDALGTSSVICRYYENGTFDATFGNNGMITTSVELEYSANNNVALLSNGKIIVSGYKSNNSVADGKDYAVIRLSNNGSLDTTFGNNGMVIIDVDDSDYIDSLKIQTDGMIVFTGYSTHLETQYTWSTSKNILRLLSNGIQDTAFGINGIVTTPISPSSIEMQTDGKIVIVGSYNFVDIDLNEIALTRYNSNGTLDATFGNNGLVITYFTDNSRSNVAAVILQNNGQIVVAGEVSEAYLSHHPNPVVLRYDSGLLSDSGFNSQKNTFSAYPNPVNQIVNLDFNLKESQKLDIDLYNINGIKVSNLLKNKEFPLGNTSQKIILPETLSKGVYFLSISNGTFLSNVKIVK